MCRYSKCTCPVRRFWRSEVVNHRTTDNVMAKRKGQLKQTMIYKTLHRKLKIEQQKPNYKPGINSSAPELCSHCGWVICQTSVRTPQKTLPIRRTTFIIYYQEKFEDTREGIRSSKSKDRQSNVEKTKRKTMIYKTVQRTQKIEQPTQITLKTEGELRCSGRVRSNCGWAQWEVIVRFVDIGRIVDHQCLINFLFISFYGFWLPLWYLQNFLQSPQT